MRRHPLLVALLFTPLAASQEPVTTAGLIEEAYDLGRLTRCAGVPYRTIQFSSYDRRSASREGPGWFANSDGFGRERVPGFEAVLRAPDATGKGLYRVARVQGQGAIVRGWTAGMGGTLRVHLDGAETPLFEGPAETFLRKRTRWFLDRAGIDDATANAFMQEDADYLPLPFATALDITWEGRIRDLHFYQIEVRVYPPGTAVKTFDPATDLHDLAPAIEHLTHPANRFPGEAHAFAGQVRPGEIWTTDVPGNGPRALTELTFDVEAPDLERALRETRLRIYFDRASIPQVEAPLGDFFGSGPGVHPYESLPFSMRPPGRLICRFVMPFMTSSRIELLAWNRPLRPMLVKVRGSMTVRPWTFDEHTMYFRAKWRVDHELIADSAAVVDLPYVVTLGRGRLVGVACMLMNPARIPTPGGNWWGEGDEKVFVDGEARPSIFGTGSEDFYNYSWSRPGLFAHPYCGQPLASGPGTSGYVSNHRFFVLDDVPFERSLAFFMELKHHRRTPGLSYGRIAYHYAIPGAVDDHRTLMPKDLVVPPLPKRSPEAGGGAQNATFHFPRDLTLDGARLPLFRAPLAPSKFMRGFHAKGGERARAILSLPRAGPWLVRLVACHRPDAGVLRVRLNGKALRSERGGTQTISLATAHATRFQNVYFESVVCPKGRNEIELEAVEPGFYGFDYFWIKPGPRPPMRVEGALEAEDLRIVSRTDGIEIERQRLDEERWSGGMHLWVRAERAGQFVELEVPVERSGKNNVRLLLTKSWDYGIVQASVDGKPAGEPIDTFNTAGRQIGHIEADLGDLLLGKTFRLRLEVTGSNPQAEAPGCYFGLDYVLLRPRPE